MKLADTSPKQATDVFRTARRDLELPASLSQAVKRFSHREGGTLFMALVAALKTLLHCYLGEEELRVATLVADRNRPGTDGLIGPMANTIILRTSLGGDPSTQEVLRRVWATTLAAFAHQDLPFEELAATLERERAVDRLLRDFQSVLEQMVSEPERPISAILVPTNEHQPPCVGRSS